MTGPSTGHIRILQVDDDPDFADLTATFLERRDGRYSVATATSAREGADRLADETFDCVVSDFDMPDRNGIEFLETVREGHPDLPFILFTGKGSEEVASEAISAGVTDYLQKRSGADQYDILENRILNSVERARSQRARRRQLDAIETAQEGISILDEDGRFVYVNGAYADLYGYDPEELVGRHWERLYRDEDVREMREEILPTVENAGYWHGETTGLRADGTTFVEDHTLSTTDEGGLVCTVRDITERIDRERELEATTRLFHDVLDTVEAAIWVRDTDGRYLLMNRADRDLLGIDDHEAVIGKTPDELFPEERAAQFREQARRVLEAGETVEFEEEVETTSGRRTFLMSQTPLFDEDGEMYAYSAIASDITGHKERERELQRYRTLVESVGDPMYVLDAEGYVEMANEAMVTALDADQEGVAGTHSSDFLIEADFERGTELIQDVLADPDRDWATYEVTVVTNAGEQFPAEINIAPLVDGGEYRGSVGVVRDVTDRKELQQQYELVVQASTDAFWDWNPKTDDITRSTEYLTQFGYDESIVGSETGWWRDRIHPEDHERVLTALDRAVENPEATYDEIYRFRRADGTYGSLRSRGIVVYDESGEAERMVGAHTDITELMEARRTLERQNERLEEFASVVSHDLRNPLNVAAGQLEMLRGECESDRIDTIARAHGRMEALISDLLMLARDGETIVDVESVDLAETVERCWRNVDTAEATLLTPADRRIRANRARLQQLLENLVRNAVEHGGEDVTVTVGMVDGGAGFYVEDDGPGIPEEKREDVFESKHSTSTQGTGLGLTIVKGIAEAHGWEISVTEGDDGGARFEVTGVEVES